MGEHMAEVRAGVEECASRLMEAIPLAMRFIRAKMCRHAGLQLSVPQFRTLAYLHRRPGANVSEAAEHLGITLPAMSRLLDRLVERGLVTRTVDPRDRRRATLALTVLGQGVLSTAWDKTRAEVAGILALLAPEQRDLLTKGLALLEQLFSGGETG